MSPRIRCSLKRGVDPGLRPTDNTADNTAENTVVLTVANPAVKVRANTPVETRQLRQPLRGHYPCPTIQEHAGSCSLPLQAPTISIRTARAGGVEDDAQRPSRIRLYEGGGQVVMTYGLAGYLIKITALSTLKIIALRTRAASP